MATTAKNKILAHRRDALLTYLRGQGHYTHVTENLERMEQLARGLTADDVEGMTDKEIDLHIKQRHDEYAMRSKLVEHHWKIVDRVLPKQIKDESDPEPDEDAVSNVHNVIERLIGERVQRSGQTIVPNGSVVPVALRPPKGGSGDTGSES